MFQPDVVFPQDPAYLSYRLLVINTFFCVCHDFVKVHRCFLPYYTEQHVVDEILEVSSCDPGPIKHLLQGKFGCLEYRHQIVLIALRNP